MTVSQNGFPASPDRNIIDVDPYFTSNNVAFPGGVLRGHVSWLFNWLITQLNSRVEPIHSGWCWGYFYKNISNSRDVSNHASGTAIDYNAPNHPIGAVNTFSINQRAIIRQILAECEHVIRWGGDYTDRKDEMHYEINVSMNEVIVVVERLKSHINNPTPNTGLSETDIRSVQRIINKWYPKQISLVEDGIWGPKTESAVRYFQGRNGLVPDGIVGPLTLQKLGM